MRRPASWFAVLVCVVLLLSAAAAVGQDWPQWRGPNRDGKALGFSPPADWTAAPTLKWKVTVGAGDATPALVGERLYVFTRQGDEEVILCLDPSDGHELWQARYAAQAVTGAAARHPGPRSSPAVAEGKVVTLGAAGVLSCLDAATGQLVWRKDPFPGVVPRFFTASSPLIVDGVAVAHLGGAGNGALIAYDLATGDEKWRWSEEGPEYGSPVLMTVEDTKQIVTLTEKSVVGVAVADGKLLWQVPFVPQGMSYNICTPVVDGEVVIYMGAGRGARAVRVQKQGEAFETTEIWNNPAVGTRFSTPVLHDGLLFGLSDRGTLFCVRAQTGETAWVDATQRDRGGFAAMVDAGSAILALPSSGELIVFEPNAMGYTELARFQVADTPTFAHPVLAGNRVFVKDEATLSLWTFE